MHVPWSHRPAPGLIQLRDLHGIERPLNGAVAAGFEDGDQRRKDAEEAHGQHQTVAGGRGGQDVGLLIVVVAGRQLPAKGCPVPLTIMDGSLGSPSCPR